MNRFTYFFLFFTIFGTVSVLGQENEYTSGWYVLSQSDIATESSVQYFDEIYTINKLPIIRLDEVQQISMIKSTTRPYEQIEFIFTEAGAKKWETETEKYAGKKLGFIFNDSLLETFIPCCKITNGKCSFGFSNTNTDIQIIFNNLKKSIEAK